MKNLRPRDISFRARSCFIYEVFEEHAVNVDESYPSRRSTEDLYLDFIWADAVSKIYGQRGTWFARWRLIRGNILRKRDIGRGAASQPVHLKCIRATRAAINEATGTKVG